MTSKWKYFPLYLYYHLVVLQIFCSLNMAQILTLETHIFISCATEAFSGDEKAYSH